MSNPTPQANQPLPAQPAPQATGQTVPGTQATPVTQATGQAAGNVAQGYPQQVGYQTVTQPPAQPSNQQPNAFATLAVPPSTASSAPTPSATVIGGRKGPTTLTLILLGVLIALAFFFLGFGVRAWTSPSTSFPRMGQGNFQGFSSGSESGSNGSEGNGSGSGSNNGGPMGGFGATGTITKVDGTTLTIKESDGSTVTVKASSSTPVTKNSTSSVSALKTGDSITVIGENDNGTISSPRAISEGTVGFGRGMGMGGDQPSQGSTSSSSN